MQDFRSLDYLQKGNSKQRAAYQCLKQARIFEGLHAFDPILVGTIPIEIDLPNSDLDIICYYPSAAQVSTFRLLLLEQFAHYSNFTLQTGTTRQGAAIWVNFDLDSFEVEIFGQNIPVTEQHAYRHLCIEAALLEHYGADFRMAVLELKRRGVKTEPAFAQVLGLSGDPYEALLEVKL